MAGIVEFAGVSKRFEHDGRVLTAIEDIDLRVEAGMFTTIIGPSGCGKTTLLRLCAGLGTPTQGTVLFKGAPVHGINREIGFVTQDSNLFPWLTLLENVEFPLLVRGVPARERRYRADDWLRLVGLTGFESYYPYQLSGGMQKRASIVRALIYEPDVVLMDEPFGALDAQTRLVLQNELQSLWQQKRKTVLFITHDLMESVALSDTVVLMTPRPGRIKAVFPVAIPRPRNVFEIHDEPGFKDVHHAIWDHFRPDILKAEAPA